MIDVEFISRETAIDHHSATENRQVFRAQQGAPESYFVVNSFKSEHRKYIIFDVRAFLVARHDTSHAAAPRVDTHRVG